MPRLPVRFRHNRDCAKSQARRSGKARIASGSAGNAGNALRIQTRNGHARTRRPGHREPPPAAAAAPAIRSIVVRAIPASCWAACRWAGSCFTQRAMPAIRPVNHLVDDQAIIIRSHLGAAIVAHAAADDGVVVCCEADDLDPVLHAGWSVIATGLARLVRDPDAITRYQQSLEPWVAGQMDYVIAIKPQIITGIRLVGWCR
jgi:Pyridoxamine 5'-phosphate oxidase